jgi:hypothetical protein
MKPIVEDKELKSLRAMVDGSKPFRTKPKLERLIKLDLKEFMTLDAQTRLRVGYYVAAKARGCPPGALPPAHAEEKGEDQDRGEHV